MVFVIHALFALLATFTPPHGGAPVLAPHIRELGGEVYVVELGGWVHEAAQLEDLDPYLLAELLYRESSGDPTKVEPTTHAAGLMQLAPGNVYGKAWRVACKREPARCDELNVRYGAAALRAAFDLCGGDPVQSVSYYRSNSCLPKEKVRERSAWLVQHAEQLKQRVNAHGGE